MSDKPCGCRAVYALHSTGASCDIEYCPLHAAAPKLLDACKVARHYLGHSSSSVNALLQVDEAVAAAKEGR